MLPSPAFPFCPMILLFPLVYSRFSPISSLKISLHHIISFFLFRDMASSSLSSILSIFFFLLLNPRAKTAEGATFTLVNKCSFTIWPGILSSAGNPSLGTTGFELPTGTEATIEAPAGWSGRFWGRTGCAADSSGHLVCATGDCGSGRLECDGAGAAPPATLAEFTLNGDSGKDFYDVSLVDGFNLPMTVVARGRAGECMSTGCEVDLNLRCPAELRVGTGDACRSACEAFGKDEFCCSGEFASPKTCQPSVFSQVFKTACPRAYSYAYDDATSTFTCVGGDYFLTFCPAGGPIGRMKSTQDATTATVTAEPGATATATATAMSQSQPWLSSLAASGARIPAAVTSLVVLAALLSAISLRI